MVFRAFRPRKSFFINLVLFPVLILSVFSFFLFLVANQNEREARNYLTNWEDEIAQNMLVEKNEVLLGKLMQHIEALGLNLVSFHDLQKDGLNRSSQVVGDQDQINGKSLNGCGFDFDVPLSLYGLPVAELKYCQPLSKLIQKTLISPLFLMAAFFLLGLVFYFRRQSWQQRLQAEVLEQKLGLHEELARVSRQVAHDIRSPLSALQTLLQVKAFSNESMDKNSDAELLLKESVERIQNISADLYERGQWTLRGKTEGIQLEKIANSLIASYQKQYQDLQFKFDTAGVLKDKKIYIPLRKEVWQRGIQNLLQNAVEAVQSKEDKNIKPEIYCRMLIIGKNLKIEIQDSGVGIAPDIISRLGEEGFTSKDQGTGLGVFSFKTALSTVAAKIEYISRPGEGCLVRILCPCIDFEAEFLP